MTKMQTQPTHITSVIITNKSHSRDLRPILDFMSITKCMKFRIIVKKNVNISGKASGYANIISILDVQHPQSAQSMNVLYYNL